MAFDVPPRRQLVFGGAVVVFAVALALVVVRVGLTGTSASRAYTEEPFYAVWGGLVLLQAVVWAIVGVASAWWWRLIRACKPADVRPRHQLSGRWLLTALGLAAGLVAPRLAMPLPYERA